MLSQQVCWSDLRGLQGAAELRGELLHHSARIRLPLLRLCHPERGGAGDSAPALQPGVHGRLRSQLVLFSIRREEGFLLQLRQRSADGPGRQLRG